MVTILKIKNNQSPFIYPKHVEWKSTVVGNKKANINIKNWILSTVLTATDEKLQKSWKGDI